MLKMIQLNGTTPATYRNLHIVDGTSIPEVAKAGADLRAAWPKMQKAERLRRDTQAAADFASEASKNAAREAGAAGVTFDAKAAKAKRRKAKEAAEEADLQWEVAGARVEALIAEYQAALVRNATALRAEALKAADAGVLNLTTARSMADKAYTELDHVLGILGGIDGVLGGDGLKPQQLLATARADSAPIPYVGVAVENLSVAVGYAATVVEAQREASKAYEKAAAIEADPAAVDGWEDDDAFEDDDDE